MEPQTRKQIEANIDGIFPGVGKEQRLEQIEAMHKRLIDARGSDFYLGRQLTKFFRMNNCVNPTCDFKETLFILNKMLPGWSWERSFNADIRLCPANDPQRVSAGGDPFFDWVDSYPCQKLSNDCMTMLTGILHVISLVESERKY